MELLQRVRALHEKTVQRRRYLHKNAETGMDIPNTFAYIESELKSFGYTPQRLGKAGIVACVGKGERVLLLRADADGLPIREETGLAFASKSGNMHACGHDLHTAMLLSCAQLLKEYESDLNITVKLLFQSAEENLKGAKTCIEKGVLLAPKVDKAVMLHALPSVPYPTGTLIFNKGKIAPSADFFRCKIVGKACHGSTPEQGVDALSIAVKTLTSLEGISARELPAFSGGVLTVGKLQAGTVANAVAGESVFEGTFRCFDEKLRERIKERVRETVSGIAKIHGGRGRTTFASGCPVLINDEGWTEFLYREIAKDLKEQAVALDSSKRAGGGSEDFAYFSQVVPSVMIGLCAGERKKGYAYPLHHPKVCFDEGAMVSGVFALTKSALAFSNS